MEKQEQKHTQEPEHKVEQGPEHREEQEQVHKEEQDQSNEHEILHTNPNPDPPPKLNSPPREPELRQLSPPRLPYHNSTPKSPPLGKDDDEEEEDRKPPSILPLPPAVATAAVETRVEPTPQEVRDEESGLGGGVDGRGRDDGFVNTGSRRKFLKNKMSILKKAKRDNMMNRALIVSRISGFVFSLVSFSVLAADKDRGWAIDSFYRYKEFRFVCCFLLMISHFNLDFVLRIKYFNFFFSFIS